MSSMFQEWSIGPFEMRNRIVRAATTESLCTKQGDPSKRMVDMYRSLARGGAGLIITGYAYVAADGKPSDRSVNLADDSSMAELRALAAAVHESAENPIDSPSEPDTRIVAQLVYGGSKSKLSPDDERRIAHGAGSGDAPAPNADVLGPSPVENPVTGLVPREASRADLVRVVNAFAAAAARAKRAGFDGVEVHAAHGYLLSQFLDARLNGRVDEYGKTLEGRARLALECVGAVRSAVGPEYPVLVKLNSCDVLGDADGHAGGLSERESMQVASWLVEAGASCIEVSGDWHSVEPDDVTGEPFFGAFGARLAKKVGVPVIVTGGWRDPEVIERYLEGTDIAAVGMARPLICQPYLPELWSSGSSRPAECISCGFCAKQNGVPCILRKGK